MSSYVPADSLVYIEINSLPAITDAVQGTDAWKKVAAELALNNKAPSAAEMVIARSGLAPVRAVISSRAQMALVVVGIDTAEKDDSLRIKPDVALVVETHTTRWRTKDLVASNIQRLAEFAYGASTCKERAGDVDYIECAEASGARKIIGAIDGTVVIVGNSDKAVESCLQVRRGQRPSLHMDQELSQAKRRLKAESALLFGYVSQINAARLFSLGAPLLIGKAPGDQQLEQLLSSSAAKIIRGVAWTSEPAAGGIEDLYQISLDSQVTKRLEPAFDTGTSSDAFWKLIPDSFRSLTVYKNHDPQAAWVSLDSALAMKLDALSAVIFASLLKSGLSGFGIEDPKQVLTSVSSPLVTLRPMLGESSLLVAPIKDEAQLRKALSASLLKDGKGQILNDIGIDPDKEKEFTAVFVNGFVIIGKTDSMIPYLGQLRNKELITPDHLAAMDALGNKGSGAIVTYSNERDSLLNMVRPLCQLSGRQVSEAELVELKQRLEQNIFSRTASILSEDGIERRSQSAFGQIGSIISLAQADSSSKPTR